MAFFLVNVEVRVEASEPYEAEDTVSDALDEYGLEAVEFISTIVDPEAN